MKTKLSLTLDELKALHVIAGYGFNICGLQGYIYVQVARKLRARLQEMIMLPVRKRYNVTLQSVEILLFNHIYALNPEELRYEYVILQDIMHKIDRQYREEFHRLECLAGNAKLAAKIGCNGLD